MMSLGSSAMAAVVQISGLATIHESDLSGTYVVGDQYAFSFLLDDEALELTFGVDHTNEAIFTITGFSFIADPSNTGSFAPTDSYT